MSDTPAPTVWRKCVVCGMPTNQGRVCTDLLCEITVNKEEEQ